MPTNAGSMLAQWTLMSHLAEPTFTTDIDPSVCDNVYVVECRNTTRMMHDIEKYVEQKMRKVMQGTTNIKETYFVNNCMYIIVL